MPVQHKSQGSFKVLLSEPSQCMNILVILPRHESIAFPFTVRLRWVRVMSEDLAEIWAMP